MLLSSGLLPVHLNIVVIRTLFKILKLDGTISILVDFVALDVGHSIGEIFTILKLQKDQSATAVFVRIVSWEHTLSNLRYGKSVFSSLWNIEINQIVIAITLALEVTEEVVILNLSDLNTTKEFLHVFKVHPE